MFTDERLEQISASEAYDPPTRLLAELIIEIRRNRAEKDEKKPAIVVKRK